VCFPDTWRADGMHDLTRAGDPKLRSAILA
jgi:hypothetical protein